MTNRCQERKIPGYGQDLPQLVAGFVPTDLIDGGLGAIRCNFVQHLHHCTKLFDGFTQFLR